MNRYGKRMKPKATRLTEAQRCESATDFKGLWSSTQHYARHKTTNRFATMFKQKLNKMYDELRRSFEMVHRNVKKLTLNVKRNQIHAFATNDSTWHVQTVKYEPWFLSKKNCALNRDVYLIERLLYFDLCQERAVQWCLQSGECAIAWERVGEGSRDWVVEDWATCNSQPPPRPSSGKFT